MDAKKLDDEQVAKEAIASSPEVTKGVVEALEETGQPKEAKTPEPVMADDGDLRNARLLAQGVNSIYRHVSEEDLKSDQVDALAELGTELFISMKQFALPKWAYVTVTLGVVAMPFIPAILKLTQPQQNTEAEQWNQQS